MKNDDIQLKEENKETPCFLESLQLALIWQYGLSIYSMDAYVVANVESGLELSQLNSSPQVWG